MGKCCDSDTCKLHRVEQRCKLFIFHSEKIFFVIQSYFITRLTRSKKDSEGRYSESTSTRKEYPDGEPLLNLVDVQRKFRRVDINIPSYRARMCFLQKYTVATRANSYKCRGGPARGPFPLKIYSAVCVCLTYRSTLADDRTRVAAEGLPIVSGTPEIL